MTNEKRLIDANALMKEANAEGAYGYVDAKQIADAPTIDAVEVRHGYWIPAMHIGDCCYRCSECQFLRDAYLLDIGNYCPNCGAKMDGGNGNSDMV